MKKLTLKVFDVFRSGQGGKMKKILKIIGIIVLVIIVLVVVILLFISKIPSVPDDYTKQVSTGGDLEATYLAMGSHEVSYFESAAMNSFEKYEIYYPTDIDEIEKLPVVVFVNGTGVKGSKYPALQKHMASWGFITIATEEEYAWNGFSAEMCVRYLTMLNEYQEDGKENVFYGKIDLENVGITGHSQGGTGVINAITEQRNADIYKAAVILSGGGNKQLSEALLWDFDETKIQTPTMMLASTGDADLGLVTLEDLQSLYENIPNDVTKLMARRKDIDHGKMLYYGDGYVTAWFMYYLQGDTEAGEAFFGADAEMLTNDNWQNVQVNGVD